MTTTKQTAHDDQPAHLWMEEDGLMDLFQYHKTTSICTTRCCNDHQMDGSIDQWMDFDANIVGGGGSTMIDTFPGIENFVMIGPLPPLLLIASSNRSSSVPEGGGPKRIARPTTTTKPPSRKTTNFDCYQNKDHDDNPDYDCNLFAEARGRSRIAVANARINEGRQRLLLSAAINTCTRIYGGEIPLLLAPRTQRTDEYCCCQRQN
ncbi:PREDICTED: uncharacterized protein LOC108556784 [Nicrophorus vespilloides]|uniref:Uncharacterized protein LOC108556784 n=1 Tax=Nicrophorus vespilloides TaxID=110193 RepID=A0ABM1M1T9_NICVS|nr:PREDICTED: uncharacterized protein LOC108556784 [Nicrophorus vespilloides]